MRSVRQCLLYVAGLVVLGVPAWAQTDGPYLISGGEARAVIVTGEGSFHHFVAEELQRYFEDLSGVRLEILTTAEAVLTPRNLGWVLIGGPQVNDLTNEAAAKGSVNFRGLKQDGFILRTVRLRGRRALVVGGNDEAATMYAAYELLERCGVVFLLSKDILPEKRSDLQLLDLNVRAETPFPRRGLFWSNVYAIWNLSEVKKFIDQMAKMKMNYLQFFWWDHEPWIDFDYRGEGKLLGDATGKETGYLMWKYQFGSFLTKDLPVGRDLYKDRPRMAPAEFQGVETPEEAFQVAKDFLNEIIRYAKKKKINIWLCIDPTTLPGNLARYATRAQNLSIPFHPILATHMCPGDPVLHEINENRLRALVATYPEAEGYFLYIPEAYPYCPDEASRSLLLKERPKYEQLSDLYSSFNPVQWGGSNTVRDFRVVRDSIAGSVYTIKTLIEARDRIAPQARLGVGGFGHAYVLPMLDQMLPKSVPFTDMESRAVWTADGVPMEHFGSMGERERTLIPRLDDDGDMFGLQFNVNLYYKDRVLEGSVENGVAGFAAQLNRARGIEHNTLYLAEGAWNPTLTPKEFYERYAGRIFGKTAREEMITAFKLLEENEEYLGWRGQKNFPCCGPPQEIAYGYGLYKQPNPFDGPLGWEGFISESHDRIRYFTRSVELLKEALEHMEKASPNVAPRGREELNYLRNKTESYILLLQTFITARRAYIEFEGAFRLWNEESIDRGEMVRRLDVSLELFDDAREKGRRTTEKFAEVVDDPSDLCILYRANLFLVTGLGLVEDTMRNIVNFHHGRHYVTPVAWNNIYHEFPNFSPAD